ncbi:hypothetical protein Rhopal_001324-T1 [Rhodotorula paludigena]|uniref:Amino acid transporter transmembrane domain-containing protein n=1 Tax=Rhodotorula paludigena TaxID=86838 RepID=A0AAV5GD08_9BASI|nr:hypothetical protein Rhopal_001324-T1 [Rhodotorula paludigena]
MSHTPSSEKDSVVAEVLPTETKQAGDDEGEVFKASLGGEDVAEFRTTIALMFKVQFSLGILGIPAVMAPVGAVPGALLIIGWGAWNTWAAFIEGAFRNRHPGMHGIQDMMYLVAGPIGREIVGALFFVGFVLVTGSGYIAGATALNGWIGAVSLYVAVFILVVAVGVNSRPAIAPPGDYELGFYAVGQNVDFLTGLAASTVIFISSSGHSANISIIAEMRNPKEYKKPIAATMSLLNVSYLVFSLVIYRYCGQWIASPSLGSAGDIIKKVTYGIGLPGIAFSTTINQHLACKYLFVRVLRDSEHLQRKTFRHWATWFSITIGVGVVAFIIAQSIPFFSLLLSFVSAISFTPLAIIVPAILWLWDFGREYSRGPIHKKLFAAMHVLIILIGAFQVVGGAYAAIQSIRNAYDAGTVANPFSCADNSNSS